MREQVVRVCTFWVYQFSKQRCASAPEESFRSAISNVGKSFILESTCLLQIMCMFVYTYRKKIHDWRWRRITFLYPILLRTQQKIILFQQHALSAAHPNTHTKRKILQIIKQTKHIWENTRVNTWYWHATSNLTPSRCRNVLQWSRWRRRWRRMGDPLTIQ